MISAILSLIAGVIPEKWNHVAPSNIESQSKSSFVARANAEPFLLYITLVGRWLVFFSRKYMPIWSPPRTILLTSTPYCLKELTAL